MIAEFRGWKELIAWATIIGVFLVLGVCYGEQRDGCEVIVYLPNETVRLAYKFAITFLNVLSNISGN